MIKQVVLDADDFQPYIYLLPHLEILKQHIPNFKITLFTISRFRKPNTPVDLNQELQDHKAFFEMVKKYDWIELAWHGLDHSMSYDGSTTKYEFNPLDRKEVGEKYQQIKEWNKKVGLEPVEVFRAPYWQASMATYKFFRDKGFTICTDRNQIRPDVTGMKQYRWNWSFEEELPDVEILKGHGHVSLPSKNNIPDQLENLKRLPQDAEYLFVSEYIKKYGSD